MIAKYFILNLLTALLIETLCLTEMEEECLEETNLDYAKYQHKYDVLDILQEDDEHLTNFAGCVAVKLKLFKHSGQIDNFALKKQWKDYFSITYGADRNMKATIEAYMWGIDDCLSKKYMGSNGLVLIRLHNCVIKNYIN